MHGDWKEGVFWVDEGVFGLLPLDTPIHAVSKTMLYPLCWMGDDFICIPKPFAYAGSRQIADVTCLVCLGMLSDVPS